MNDKLRKVLNYRYNAEIQDALYKIQCFSEQELLIPEHPDITAEVDKLLQKIAEAEDKMAVMELHYDGNVANCTLMTQKTQNHSNLGVECDTPRYPADTLAILQSPG